MTFAQQRIELLKSKLEKICKLQLKKFKAGSCQFEAYAIEDMDTVVDWLIEQGEDHPDAVDERLPYWGEVWPSSLALAAYLNSADWIKSDMSILELGCGPGLAGLGAVARTKTITLSDYQQEALDLSKINWLHNVGFEPETLLLDWRKPDESLKFDIILAADIAYEQRFFHPIFNTFKKMLIPGGSIILSEPGRMLAYEFFKLLEETGWKCNKLTTTNTLISLQSA